MSEETFPSSSGWATQKTEFMAELLTHTTRLGHVVVVLGVMPVSFLLDARLSQLALILAVVLDLLQPAPVSSGSNQQRKEPQAEESLCPPLATRWTSRQSSRLLALFATQLTMSKDI